MPMSALEKARELEKQRQQVLSQGAEEALQKATAAFRELRELVDEQMRAMRNGVRN
jgi:hypothetical protein